MSAHFLIYRTINAPVAVACNANGDGAKKFAEEFYGPRAVIVRMTTGQCPICKLLVSTLHAEG